MDGMSSLLRMGITGRVDLMLSVNTGLDSLTYERREMEKAFVQLCRTFMG